MRTIKYIILFSFVCFYSGVKSQQGLFSTSLFSSSYAAPAFHNSFKKQNITIIRRPNNFDEGLVWYSDLGFSGGGRHLSFNTSLAWQTYGGWEFGLGLGGHVNQLDIPINNENGTLEISGAPLYAYTKYYLANFFDNIIKPYVKLSAGYSFNSSEEGTTSGNGIMFENGIGVNFKLGRDYIFTEFSQYNMRAKGSVQNPDSNLDLNFKVWFNDLVFRIGYGRRLIY